MEDLHIMLKNSADTKVKNEILRLVQAWAHAFRKEPSFKAVQDEMRIMKAEGFQFPALKESDAMFSADSAPEWFDGESCHRCRYKFSMLIRKHHCRSCGQVFCAKCSSKTSTIPKFGIEKEVRVCDVCFEKINKKIDIKPVANDETKLKTISNSSSSGTKTKTEQEIREEEDLLLALALSQSEAENREMKQKQNKQKSFTNGTTSQTSQSSKSQKKSSKTNKTNNKCNKKTTKEMDENEDPELARYLNRDYWEQKVKSTYDYENSPSPSAPQPVNSITKIENNTDDNKIIRQNKLTQPLHDDELEAFTKNLQSSIEIFVNRLNSNKLRGRPITNDTGVQALFMNLTNMHSHLMMYMQQTSESRSNCERIQDKINQIRDARAALDALRDEHREQMKRAAAEAELIRQQQMAQKLEIMRKKKQEYLQFQRELAIQRMQEQERGLMMRAEQLRFSTTQPNVPNLPSNPVWHMVPPNPYPQPVPPNMNPNYYMENANNFVNPSQPGSHMNPQQMVDPNQQQILPGQYPSQVSLANNAPIVPSHPTMMHPQMHVPGAMLPQMMPHYSTQPAMSAPQMYMPPNVVYNQVIASNPVSQDIPQQQQQPQQQQPQQMIQNMPQQQPPNQPVKEELLISFD